MSQLALRKLPPLAIVGIGALAASLVATIFVVRSARDHAPNGERGAATLTLSALPSDSPRLIDYVVRSSDGTWLADGTAPVTDSVAPVRVNIPLPVGNGHTVTFSANAKSPGGVAPGSTLATKTFDVVAGQITQVNANAKTDSPSPIGTEGLRNAARAIGDGTTGVFAAALSAGGDALRSCQACQQANATGKCDPPFLTATSDTNPSTGEQKAIGWGCATLPTPAAQNACVALVRCLNAHDCTHANNPVMVCYCGTANPAACIGGSGVDGACVAEYRAAAAASPGGPALTASGPQASAFIATASSDPTTAVGLADNIKQCAASAGCSACDQL